MCFHPLITFRARRNAGLGLGLWALCVCLCPATAAENETRHFNVLVDGKPAGEYRLTIRQENGSFVITGQVDVKVRYLGIRNYIYTYRGTEVWKEGRLQRLDSSTVDDRKRYSVTAWVDGNNLRIKTNGQERPSRPDLWTTSYWRLPDARFRNAAVPLLDVDTGREIPSTLQIIGVNPINAAGTTLNCARYRLTGGVQVELWYDPQERLVREELVEDGHRTVLELTRIER